MLRKNFTFTCLSSRTTDTGFDILAINEGEAKGHGISFSAAVLKDSLPLWDELPCFLDHPSFFAGQSVRDLAGAFHNPSWDESEKGIRLQLIPNGPASSDLTALREAAKADQAIMKAIGFSAVLRLQYKNSGEVTKIISVASCDTVIDPARGGKFLSAQYPIGRASVKQASSISATRVAKEGGTMSQTNPQTAAPAIEDEEQEEVVENQTAAGDDPNVTALRNLSGTQDTIAQLNQDAQASRAVLTQMYANLLTTGLATSKLPAPMQTRIRDDFTAKLTAGQLFEPKDLQDRIDADRKLMSEISANAIVQGPARSTVTGMYSTDDQITAAVHDMFQVARPEGLEKIKAARLTGIRELYFMLTGDRQLRGGYHPSEIYLATTADFSGLVANVMNKVVSNQWDELGRAGYDWWQQIVKIEHFESLNDITGVLVGTVGTLPTVGEQEEYPELAIGDSPETASFVKKGGYIALTLEMIDRDQTRKLMHYPKELANASLRTLSARIAAIFTANSATGPQMADTGYLFNSTALTTKGGHANLLTTALSAAQWDVVAAAVYNQPMLIKNDAAYLGTGPKMALEPTFCLVPRALRKTAYDTFLNEWDVSANVHSANLLKGLVKPVVVPEWTDTNDWAAVCDPDIAPSIIVGERFGLKPEIFVAGRENDPSVFMNDEHRIKVRDFKAVLVQDFRPLHKENV